MQKNPVFDLFEIICTELAGREDDQVIDESNLSDENLINDLKNFFRQTDAAKAFEEGINAISDHFEEKQAKMPFEYDLATRVFSPIDRDFLDFITFSRGHRSIGGSDSKDFEIKTLHRIKTRVTGDLRRIGTPRDNLKTKPEIIPYLMRLGFERNVLEPRDQDGGFDILWLPPLGTIPLRPIISLQCKNSPFDESEANSSAGRAQRTLSRHSHLRSCGFIKFVVFNDYIDKNEYVGRAVGWEFIPLGLTDLATALTLNNIEIL